MKVSILSKKAAQAICFFSAIFASAMLSADYGSGDYYGSGWDQNCFQRGAVFASYRNNDDQIIPNEGNVTFDVVDTNEGHGIEYDDSTGEFLIKKTGTYSISYGVTGNISYDPECEDSTQQLGFDLVVISDCDSTIKDQIFSGQSSSILLQLVKGERVKLTTQPSKKFTEYHLYKDLINGRCSTEFQSDTSYITFVRMR